MNDHQAELERLRAAIDASGDVAYDWNLSTDSVEWLGEASRVFGVPDHLLMKTGARFNDRVHPDDLPRRLEAITDLAQSNTSFECEYRVRGGEGEQRWFHDRGIAELGPDGRPVRLRGSMRPITQRKAAPPEIEYIANYDSLTGHYNQTRLREALDQALYYSLRYQVEGCFLVVGIDKINMVNQAFGYEVANSVIIAVGQRLDRCLRACDMIGRIGDDRYGVVLSNCPEEDLQNAAEKILETARDTAIDTLAGPIHVTVSIGAVAFPESVRTPSDAMTKADIALQKSKRDGRNTWSMYRYTDAQREGHRKNMIIAEQVNRALREDRLLLSFQPIVDAATHKTVMHECLLRMIQPDGEVVAAGAFMPVVEELGLIRLIDRKVLDLAIDVLGRYPEINLAVNVSGLTASDRSWLRHVVALLHGRTDLARRLVIEITETAGLEDIEESARFVSTLHELGCRVALDDFGAGYTSFRQLKILSVDMVKIDGSFIQELGKNPNNMIFIRSLIDLARNFDLITVAECVETMAEAELLAKEGVALLQGYAFGRPNLDLDLAASTEMVGFENARRAIR
ncbi:MAG: EAL domain-containing protein [Alphaproteobacteria bacterium]